ncbi:histone H1-like [Ictalurus punctatus]|uniref:Histone H1-like n=1 Tax=Ictalurus punctatus TaxID=7998 RepID=A0A9F7R716_ICTPU|nr:histone H1-like [Ictalurus punctatus]
MPPRALLPILHTPLDSCKDIRLVPRLLFNSARTHTTPYLLFAGFTHHIAPNAQPAGLSTTRGRAFSCALRETVGSLAGPREKRESPSSLSVCFNVLNLVLRERSGVSLAALKKALAAGGYDVEKNNSRVKNAVKGLVTKGTLVQTKGTGASGSFKLNKKQTETRIPSLLRRRREPAAAAKKATKSPKKAKSPRPPKKAAKSPKKRKLSSPRPQSLKRKAKKAAPKKK